MTRLMQKLEPLLTVLFLILVLYRKVRANWSRVLRAIHHLALACRFLVEPRQPMDLRRRARLPQVYQVLLQHLIVQHTNTAPLDRQTPLILPHRSILLEDMQVVAALLHADRIAYLTIQFELSRLKSNLPHRQRVAGEALTIEESSAGSARAALTLPLLQPRRIAAKARLHLVGEQCMQLKLIAQVEACQPGARKHGMQLGMVLAVQRLARHRV